MKAYFLLFAGILFLLSCTDQSKNILMPEIKDCDSATIMYYITPGNPKFFSMSKVRNIDSLLPITADVNGKIITGKDSCTTLGKIFFYGKEDVVYPVYFSTDPGCMTFSFIKTGEKYFTKMGAKSKAFLERYRITAKEPGSE